MDTDTDMTATDALEAAQVDAVERGGADTPARTRQGRADGGAVGVLLLRRRGEAVGQGGNPRMVQGERDLTERNAR